LAQYIRFLIAQSLLFALAVTLPNLLLRIAVAGAKPQINAALVLMSAVASPMSEELQFRGYLFGQLYRRAGWPFWAAALVNAVPFVAGHFYQLSGKGWEFVVSVAEVLLLGVSAQRRSCTARTYTRANL
jgi:hypothetical protein